ncbi:transcriptional regulator [Kitasatospora sp. NPDC096077]|uniref:transcriptional regulator n=1 Tax=Kitasatospora sp. NPDC096077 TaxID=3155544 RepID=UPI00332D888A
MTAVPIAALRSADSPRGRGLDTGHVALLAAVDGPLPPILVHRADLRIIDGTHRVEAARQQGRTVIGVEFFDGTAHEAFLRSVETNTRHGLPLSPEDRRAAAARILGTHPQLSDRAIAGMVGLGAKAVASLRRRSTAAAPQSDTSQDGRQDTPRDTPRDTRIGRDGRVRAVSGREGRLRAAALIAEDPQASLRTISRNAGISPATVADVRKRLAAGLPPVSGTTADVGPGPSIAVVPDSRAADRRRERAVPASAPAPSSVPGPDSLLERLFRDPSLRLREDGRQLLRLLRQNADAEWSELVPAVPAHCGSQVGHLARQYAADWLEFARRLDARGRSEADATT